MVYIYGSNFVSLWFYNLLGFNMLSFKRHPSFFRFVALVATVSFLLTSTFSVTSSKNLFSPLSNSNQLLAPASSLDAVSYFLSEHSKHTLVPVDSATTFLALGLWLGFLEARRLFVAFGGSLFTTLAKPLRRLKGGRRLRLATFLIPLLLFVGGCALFGSPFSSYPDINQAVVSTEYSEGYGELVRVFLNDPSLDRRAAALSGIKERLDQERTERPAESSPSLSVIPWALMAKLPEEKNAPLRATGYEVLVALLKRGPEAMSQEAYLEMIQFLPDDQLIEFFHAEEIPLWGSQTMDEELKEIVLDEEDPIRPGIALFYVGTVRHAIIQNSWQANYLSLMVQTHGPLLRDLLNHPHWGVRAASVQALRELKIQDREFLNALLSLFPGIEEELLDLGQRSDSEAEDDTTHLKTARHRVYETLLGYLDPGFTETTDGILLGLDAAEVLVEIEENAQHREDYQLSLSRLRMFVGFIGESVSKNSELTERESYELKQRVRRLLGQPEPQRAAHLFTEDEDINRALQAIEFEASFGTLIEIALHDATLIRRVAALQGLLYLIRQEAQRVSRLFEEKRDLSSVLYAMKTLLTQETDPSLRELGYEILLAMKSSGLGNLMTVEELVDLMKELPDEVLSDFIRSKSLHLLNIRGIEDPLQEIIDDQENEVNGELASLYASRVLVNLTLHISQIDDFPHFLRFIRTHERTLIELVKGRNLAAKAIAIRALMEMGGLGGLKSETFIAILTSFEWTNNQLRNLDIRTTENPGHEYDEEALRQGRQDTFETGTTVHLESGDRVTDLKFLRYQAYDYLIRRTYPSNDPRFLWPAAETLFRAEINPDFKEPYQYGLERLAGILEPTFTEWESLSERHRLSDEEDQDYRERFRGLGREIKRRIQENERGEVREQSMGLFVLLYLLFFSGLKLQGRGKAILIKKTLQGSRSKGAPLLTVFLAMFVLVTSGCQILRPAQEEIAARARSNLRGSIRDLKQGSNDRQKQGILNDDLSSEDISSSL